MDYVTQAIDLHVEYLSVVRIRLYRENTDPT